MVQCGGGLAIVMCLWLTGCSSTSSTARSGGAYTTRYRAADILLVTETVADRLAAHAIVAGRDATSDAIRIVPAERMENRSSERLSRTDQWATMALILLDPAMLQLFSERNIEILMPPERMRAMADRRIPGLDQARVLAPEDQPTHVFHAVFSSMTRGADVTGRGVSNERKDLFIVEFTLVNLATGQAEWVDSFEFARTAGGTLAD